jgi:hypothetical protein
MIFRRIVSGRVPSRRLSGLWLNIPSLLYRTAPLMHRVSKYRKSLGA